MLFDLSRRILSTDARNFTYSFSGNRSTATYMPGLSIHGVLITSMEI